MRQSSEIKVAPWLNHSDLPEIANVIGEYLALNGVTAYLVGGTIRDVLLRKKTSDIDLSIKGDPLKIGEGIAELLSGRLILLDTERQIVRIVFPNLGDKPSIDITPLRGEIQENLSHRDFTLDAMALSVSDLHKQKSRIPLIDPFNGTKDINCQVIRAISPSVFKLDPARLIRAPRLASELNFEICDDTAKSIKQHSYFITKVAPEKIRDEFLKLLASPSGTFGIKLLDDLGILCLMIPELESTKGITQPEEHHWDVFNHSVETVGHVENLLNPNSSTTHLSNMEVASSKVIDGYFSEVISDGHTRLTLLKLAGLLHDIAKPATRSVDISGHVRFLEHSKIGAEMSRQILENLRLSRRGINLVNLMVEHHLRPSQMSHDGKLPTNRAVFRYYRDTKDAAIDTLYLNLADYLGAKGPDLHEKEWNDHCFIVGHILKSSSITKKTEPIPKLIDGHDIMSAFSMKPGPCVGSLLNTVTEAQASGEIMSKEEAIELIEYKLTSGGVHAQVC